MKNAKKQHRPINLSIYSLVLVLGIVILGSCQSETLNRENSKEALIKYFKTDSDSTLYLKTDIYAVVLGSGKRYQDDLKKLQPFINSGLLRFQKKEVRNRTQPIYWYIYSITNKGRPYVVSEKLTEAEYPVYRVKAYNLYVDEITGIRISPDNKQAIVDFTLSAENITPFGAPIIDTDFTSTKIALFALYDDGWRIEKVE